MALMSGGRMLERLRAGERLLGDGAMGSELIRRGFSVNAILQANLVSPTDVTNIHSHYLAAGADILTSNTFGLYEGDAWICQVVSGLSLAIQSAQSAARPVGVWLSIPAMVLAGQKEALHLLAGRLPAWSGSLLIETCVSFEETLAAIRNARLLAPVVLAITAHIDANGNLLDGTSLENFARMCEREQAKIVGANCGNTPEDFIDATARLRSASPLPLLIQPAAGLPVKSGGVLRYPAAPAMFADVAAEVYAHGAAITGGCCGTSPAHISAIRARLVC